MVSPPVARPIVTHAVRTGGQEARVFSRKRTVTVMMTGVGTPSRRVGV